MKKVLKFTLTVSAVITLFSCDNYIREEVSTLDADEVIIKGKDGNKYRLIVITDSNGNPLVSAEKYEEN